MKPGNKSAGPQQVSWLMAEEARMAQEEFLAARRAHGWGCECDICERREGIPPRKTEGGAE